MSFFTFPTAFKEVVPNVFSLAFCSVGQRKFSSGPPYSTTFLTKSKQETFKKNWLSDPSAYPLIGVMGIAGALVVGVIGGGLMYNPDVQITPSRRGSIMRTWEF